MKKKLHNPSRIVIAALTGLLLLNLSIASAQSNLIIGSGSQMGTSVNSATGDSGPMYKSTATSNFVYSRYSFLYTATELASGGLVSGDMITDVSWFKANNAMGNSPCVFEVWIKNSSLTTIGAAGQGWTNVISGSTQVYSNTSHMVDSTIGWHQITFNAPFVYSGGALEIATNFDMSQGTSPWTTAGFSWKKDPMTNVTLSYCGNAAPGAVLPNLRTVRPQIKIGYTPFTAIKETANNTTLAFDVSPNPANETLQINFEATLNVEHNLCIYSANGKAVLTQTLTANSPANQYQVDVSNLPAGMYLVQIKNSNRSFSKKIFLE
ncbi:MAG TPA: T9SS type A sorting domain-containing protein [Bacteroidia bacterium]|nr:T9SS type A sorting domain-containing protein [Bacteroidia bacterium]